MANTSFFATSRREAEVFGHDMVHRKRFWLQYRNRSNHSPYQVYPLGPRKKKEGGSPALVEIGQTIKQRMSAAGT